MNENEAKSLLKRRLDILLMLPSEELVERFLYRFEQRGRWSLLDRDACCPRGPTHIIIS